MTCVPKKIGYTQEQADKLFDPNRRFYMCSARAMLKEILWIEDGKFHLKCPEHQFPEIVIGGYLKDELLGQVEFSNRWKPYTEPVDLNGREFAFSRCLRSKKQAILYNNFNRTAAERAENITDNLAKEFGMVSKPRPQTVIMLLFDSLSRQHFYRNLPKTIDFLNKEVDGGAYSNTVMYDFVINNAQGENTIPNLVPLLYGYNLNWHLKRLEGYKLKDESH